MGSAEAGILLVCTANVCRSPAAELALRRRFSEQPAFSGVQVSSAGVRVAESLAICNAVAQYREDEHWERMATAHRASSLEPDDVRRASLVLTATREQRSTVVGRMPELRDRVFTLREAVWLGEGYSRTANEAPADTVEAFRAHANGMRGLRPLPRQPRLLHRMRREHDEFDIRDGHSGRRSVHLGAVRQAFEAAEALATMLTAAGER